MRRSMLLVTIALTIALTVALSGAALAVPGNAQGSGGHVEETNLGLTTIGGGSGGSEVSGQGGGGGGGCITFLGNRGCGGSGGPR